MKAILQFLHLLPVLYVQLTFPLTKWNAVVLYFLLPLLRMWNPPYRSAFLHNSSARYCALSPNIAICGENNESQCHNANAWGCCHLHLFDHCFFLSTWMDVLRESLTLVWRAGSWKFVYWHVGLLFKNWALWTSNRWRNSRLWSFSLGIMEKSTSLLH